MSEQLTEQSDLNRRCLYHLVLFALTAIIFGPMIGLIFPVFLVYPFLSLVILAPSISLFILVYSFIIEIPCAIFEVRPGFAMVSLTAFVSTVIIWFCSKHALKIVFPNKKTAVAGGSEI